MNKKDYSFTYIRYRFSNLMLIPICFFVLVLADYFEQMAELQSEVLVCKIKFLGADFG